MLFWSGGRSQARCQTRRRSSGTVSGRSSACRSTLKPPPGSCLAQDGEIGMGQHGECDMAMPTDPAAHFVMIQANLALGGLEAGLDRPAPTGDLHQIGQRRRRRRVDQIKGQFRPIGDGTGGSGDLAATHRPSAPVFVPAPRPSRRDGDLSCHHRRFADANPVPSTDRPQWVASAPLKTWLLLTAST